MRIVGHLDMDAFFAAIEERDQASLRGLPIAVGADPRAGRGRGVVSTANYKAREYGIQSAMPISRAWRLSVAAKKQGKPEVVFLPVDMEKYAQASARVMSILRRFAPVVEQASIDEAYVDLSFAGSFTNAQQVCRNLKAAIQAEEHLTASVGIGPNKLVAKIASGAHKPDGLTVVTEEEAEEFLAALPVRAIPGIGPKTDAALARMGIGLVRDLKRLSRDELRAMLGKRGLDLYEKIRGRDESPVQEAYEVKSIGEQETFAQDTRDPNFMCERLTAMCEHIFRRLSTEGFTHFRTIVLTVRFADFETTSRSHTLAEHTNALSALQFEAMKLLMPFLDSRENPHHKLIRLLGVRVEKLQTTADA
ncbi:MAG: DNA polymerase IV [Nitrospirae bacterium]|nr:DNA polymerase IV [Nitrospirota bacterium]